MRIREIIVDWSNRLLIIFSQMVEGLKLTPKIMDKFPIVRELLTPEELTLILTVVVGISIVMLVYAFLINISKFTLNFLVFLKWATVIIIISGIILNILS